MKRKDKIPGTDIFPERTGYQVPNGYFDELTDKIMDRVDIPTYDDTDLPESYFESLPDRIMSRTGTEESSGRVVKMSGWKKYMSIAASLAIFIMGYNYFNTDAESDIDMVASDELILEYLDEYDVDLETATLSELEFIKDEFNVMEVVEESDELYEYYLDYHIDDLPANELEEIIK
ncbi:MAG: hypothetical protein HKN68_01685 [Saprospiraceae bacterium]|nr:hypothetical protein [Saprospiraceae bacterium]